MIELLSRDRCVKCDLCVEVCPTRVFAPGEDGIPVIARQADCQTCYMCELYCPADALFVAPEAEVSRPVDEAELAENGLLGSYRRTIGWTRETRDRRRNDSSHIILDKYFSDTL